MKIYNHIDEFIPLKNAAVTIGTFDGVHIGHQKIISQLKKEAKKIGGETVILTFFPHPRMILHPEDQSLKLITTMPEKAELLKQMGIDHLIITPFTRDFSNLSPEEYIKQVLIDRIGTKKIVIGYDHRFGKDRSGGLPELQAYSEAYGYTVTEIPEQDINEITISSTKIRMALQNGRIKEANEFLGHIFTLNGKVIKGDQIGRTLGYPTANLFIEEDYKLIPCDGIYAVEVMTQPSSKNKNQEITNLYASETVSGETVYQGMAYIGHRPTINGMSQNIEVNIFDFNEDIYHSKIKLLFHDFIRHDIKFNSLEELKTQLAADKIAVLKKFGA
ncbi:bifunctional riboflavin kinase/FAD synthetase [Pseudopedobacter sp.]|uniref:bifunctional riboflavin kinase/FAD synthetase n=1 Tax=Pseudopedobacter sp. TaxID=1936787 RepID=UPI00333F907D